MKKILVSGTRGYIPGLPFMNTAEAMQSVGQNCGNLMFQYAVEHLLDEPTLLAGKETSWDPVEIREECRVVVIPSANFLRENFDFTAMVNFLEGVNLPLVFIGLGAQADDFEKDKFNFHPSILRLLDLIRERSEKVSIRGEFTARVLERYNITNYEVTGCPSNFINPSPDFTDQIMSKLNKPMRHFITHADEPWPKNPLKSQVERKLVEWTQLGSGIMIQQSVPPVMKYLRKNNPFSTEEVAEGFEFSLMKAMMPDMEVEDLQEFAALKLRTYYSADQWMEDSSKFDFSLGLRLHGNMAAWQSGTPSLWITHDARTQELVDTMALPNIGLEDFLENCDSVEDAWDRFEFDPVAYKTRRGELRGRVNSVFAAAGVKVK